MNCIQQKEMQLLGWSLVILLLEAYVMWQWEVGTKLPIFNKKLGRTIKSIDSKEIVQSSKRKGDMVKVREKEFASVKMQADEKLGKSITYVDR